MQTWKRKIAAFWELIAHTSFIRKDLFFLLSIDLPKKAMFDLRVYISTDRLPPQAIWWSLWIPEK